MTTVRVLISGLVPLIAISGCGGGGDNPTPGAPATYSLGGTVTGLPAGATGLTLANGAATVTVTAGASAFSFSSAYASGASYTVSVQTAPTGYACTVSGGTGTLSGNVSNVAVNCAVQTFKLSGTISGLGNAGGLILGNNRGDATTIAAGATTFSMATAAAYGAAYNVTVTQDPAGNLRCLVTQGAGTMPAAAVTNLAIACAPWRQTVIHTFNGTTDGYFVSGLTLGVDGALYGLSPKGGAHNTGLVFRMDLAGNESVLRNFTAAASQPFPGITLGGPDGGTPIGSLVQATDGNFYGMTQNGGSAGHGVVLRLDTTGNETVLHSFTGTPDGNSPSASFLQGRDGNFYGLASQGGDNSSGVAYKLDAAGNLTVLHAFSGGIDGGQPGGGLIEVSSGTFYGLAPLGGASNCGVAFRVDAAGNQTVLHSFTAATEGCWPGALLQGRDGYLYGTLGTYGPSNSGAVFKMDLAGNVTVLYAFTGGADGGPPSLLVQTPDGSLYGGAAGGPNPFVFGLFNNYGVIFRLN